MTSATLQPATALQLLIDAVADYAIYALDADGLVISWNAGAERNKGYPAEEIVGRHFEVFFVPDDRAAGLPAALLALAREHGQHTHEGWRVRKDGTRIWVNATITALRDESGAVVGYGKVTRDLTAAKSAADALRASEARYRQLAGSMADAYLVVEGDPWQVVFANDSCDRLFGIAPHQLIAGDRAISDILHPEDRDRLLSIWAHRDLEGHDQLEFRIVRDDGKLLWVRARYSWSESEGSVERLTASFEDVTDRRLAHEQLDELRRVATEANRAKNDFLSRMSHELRTPLNAVLGFAQLLDLDGLGPDHAEAVHQILQSGKHLLTLIDEVLDITRIEAGQLRLSTEAVAVADLARDVVELLAPMARDAGVTVEVDEPDPGLTALADSQRIRQVLLNLLSNAVKYNRAGGRVTLRVRSQGGEATVAVVDTGRGIADSYMSRLFMPFERLGAEALGIEGTGVGLALSRSLAEAMNGTLTATSVLGEGSTFVLRLPRTDADTAPPRRSGSRAAVADAPQPGTAGSKRLVYIEDNPSNVRLLEQILRRRPVWHLEHAPGIAIGVALVKSAPPDLLLLDLHLSDGDGLQALLEVRADPRCRAVPIHVVSADATPGQVSRLVDAGADGYITKPIDVAALLDLLDVLAAR